MANSVKSIRKVIPQLSSRLFTRPNLVATGIGYKRVHGKMTGELCIICSVETKVRASSLSVSELIPPFIDGIPTDVHPVGLIHPFAASQGTDKEVYPGGIILPLKRPTSKFRPVPGGVSIGHVHVTAGTLGCLVKKGNSVFILSNNHVLANSNNASPGDIIIQPGGHDGGIIPEDQVARLSEFVPIWFEGETGSIAFSGFINFLSRLAGRNYRMLPGKKSQKVNLVDCAIAEPVNENDFLNEIFQIGKISGTREGSLGMEVKKSGRTTGLTTGSIEQVDVSVRVSFGANKRALFTDQYIAGAMSQGGDSGSVVLSQDNQAVGLLFAGSTNTTIINRIQNVFQLLDISLA
jgi:hypothetical protein